MKSASIVAVLLSALVALPHIALAACGSEKREFYNVRYYPKANSMKDWPTEATVDIGTIVSFLAPVGAKVKLDFPQKGSMAPMNQFDETAHEQMRASTDLSPPWIDIDYDAKKWHWLHIYAGSYGVTNIHLSAPDWSKDIKVTSYYRSPLRDRVPPIQLTLEGEARRSITVNARDNLEITVPGTVADGWSAAPESETGFKLMRVEQVWKLGDDAQVKLFFAGNASLKSTTMVLRRAQGKPPRNLEFDILVRPAVAC
jgi:hypothetical protein